MALAEHELEELVVGMYDRSFDMPDSNKVLNVGCSLNLKSGIWSPWLVNMRPALSYDQNSVAPLESQRRTKQLLLEAYADSLGEVEAVRPFDHVVGLPEAGTPLASAVAAVGGYSVLWLRVGEVKAYGTHNKVEGAFYPSERVVMVDDVVTDGATKAENAKILDEFELDYGDVVVVADREQGGKEALRKHNMEMWAPLGAKAIFGYLASAGRITAEQHDFLVHYTENPAPLKEPADFPWPKKS